MIGSTLCQGKKLDNDHELYLSPASCGDIIPFSLFVVSQVDRPLSPKKPSNSKNMKTGASPKMTFKLYVLLICYTPIVDIFLPKTNFGDELPDIDAIRLFSYLIVITFILGRAIEKKPISFSKWTSNQFVFSMIVLLSLAWSQEPFDIHTLSAIFDTVFIPFLITIISSNIFLKKEIVDQFIKNLCLAAFILSTISLYLMFFSQHSQIPGSSSFRSAGFGKLSNPNGLAIFLVMTIPCILHGIKNKKINAIIGWAIMFFIFAGVICTVSRKGITTMVLTTLIFFSLTGQIKKAIFICIATVLTVALLSNFGNIANRFEKQTIEHQLKGKANMAFAGVKMFLSSPVIGKGYRGYHNNWKKYFPFSDHEKYSAHNIFVTALANYGLVGIFPFMMIFLYPIFISLKILLTYSKSETYEHLRAMAIICISTVTCFMISGYFAGGIFYQPNKMTLLYTIISFTLGAYETKKKSKSNNNKEANNIEKHNRWNTRRCKEHIYQKSHYV